MKVLHVHDAPHIHGGATGYLKRLLPELERRGVESALFSLDEVGGFGVRERAFRYDWPRNPLRRRLDFSRGHAPLAQALTAFAREVEAELIHVQNVAAFRTTLFPAMGRLAVPVVMTVHDFSLIDPNPWGLPRVGLLGPWKRSMDRGLMERAQRAVFAAVDCFLCPTEALRDGIPFPSGKARLQRLPIEPRDLEPSEPEGPLRLFFAGTLYRSKGVDLLLEALATARGAASSAKLSIAGVGDQEQALRAQCQRLGLSDRVQFLGFCQPEAMERAYADAHLQILPSRVPENSPLTVLEAGARGRPSLASHAGGVPELIAPPERGWTFSTEDVAALRQALEEAADAPEEIQRRGRNMQAWVRREFDPDRHWDSVFSAYEELLR